MSAALTSNFSSPVCATFYDWLMFARVLAAMVWLGGWAMLGILAVQALRQPDLDPLRRFSATIRFVGPRLLAPFTILVAGLGTGLVLDSNQWDFGQLSIDLAIGLLRGVFLTGAARAIANHDADQAARHIASRRAERC